MARFYTEISKFHFLQKVEAFFEKEEFPYNLPAKIKKDLEKVNFDWENCTSFEDTKGFGNLPIGYRQLKPDFHIFFVNAGGDWEFPICFILYWNDGLRAYIPKDGNSWNRKEKCAYGSEDDLGDALANAMNQDPESEVSELKMITEIIGHITKK